MFTDNQKAIINNDRTTKYVTLTFPNTNIADIGADKIYQESMSLEESLFDSDNLQFGKCNSSLFKIKVADFTDNIDNAEIDVTITFTHETLGSVVVPFGKYLVQSVERTSDRRWRIITATDFMTKFDVDISNWYNNTLYPTSQTTRTVKYIREALCSYIGVDYEDVTLVNDNLVVGKTIEPTSLSGRELLQYCCEVNCCFGHFDWEGTLQWVTVNTSSMESITSYVEGCCDYADFDVKGVNTVEIIKEDGGIGALFQSDRVISGIELENKYCVTGNPLLFGYNQTELTSLAEILQVNMYPLSYRPTTTKVFSMVYMPLGQYLAINATYIDGSTIQNNTFYTFLIKREIKGIQALFQNIIAEGNEYLPETQSSLINEYKILLGKSAKYKRDIESLESEFTDFETETNSKFIQTSNEITSTVGKMQTVWVEEHPIGTTVSIKYKNYGIPQSTVATENVESLYPNYAINDLYLNIDTGKVYKLTATSISGNNTLFTWVEQYTLTSKDTATNAKFIITDESITAAVGRISELETDMGNAENAISGLQDDIDDVYTKEEVNASINVLEDEISINTSSIESLQRQVNGELETYVGDEHPLPSNYPANTWDNTTRLQKIGTKYYCTDGTAWQWMSYMLVYGDNALTYGNNALIYYYWRQIADTGVAEALQLAQQALDIAEDTSDVLATNYSTTTEMNAAINVSKQEIEQTVSQTYATQASLETVDGKFANVYTKSETNTAINQSAQSIEQTVSETYSTKAEVNNIQVGSENIILNSLDYVGDTHFMFNSYLTYGTLMLTYKNQRLCY